MLFTSCNLELFNILECSLNKFFRFCYKNLNLTDEMVVQICLTTRNLFFAIISFNYIHVLTFLYCQIKMLKGINHDQRNSLAWSDKHAHKYTQLKANWDLNWKRVSKECLRRIFLISQNFRLLKFFYINIALFRIMNLSIYY